MADENLMGTTEALLLETFGLPLLCFLCATDEQTMRDRLRGRSLPGPAEVVLLSELVPLAQRVAAQPEVPKMWALGVLGRPAGAGSTSIGLALRKASGGDVYPELVHSGAEDPVKRHLTRMAIDVFPLLLAPTDGPWRMHGVSLFNHPLRQDLQTAVQADDALGRIYTADDGELGRRGYLLNSLGRGGTVQDVMFGETVITSAWDMAAMTYEQPGLIELVAQVHLNIDTVRDAISGGQPSVPAKLIFTGFTTGSREISTPWGTLRPLLDWERRLAPPSLEGAVSGTDEQGRQVTTSYAGEMVLVTEIPYRLLVDVEPDYDDFSEWERRLARVHDSDGARRRFDVLPLSVLLATDRPVGSWVTAKLAWNWAADPLGHGHGIGWTDVRSGPGFMPYELSEAECQAVADWASRVDEHWIPQINIAVRRLLSAANARSDLADRLVDAVIVWENLFGTRQGESGLRISSAMAVLLADDPATRELVRADISRVYNDRSAIVHGRQLNHSVLIERANAALLHARDVMRVLFRDRPDVLKLVEDGARSVRLIMGG